MFQVKLLWFPGLFIKSAVFLCFCFVLAGSSDATIHSSNPCQYAFNTISQTFNLRRGRPKKDDYLMRGGKKKLIVSRRHYLADTSHIKPDIDFDQLSSVQNFTPVFHSRLFYNGWFKTAEWNGKKVFLKIIIVKKHLRELNNFRSLKSRGVPTLFMGITKSSDGKFYMVSQFQEGAFFRIKPQHLGRYFSEGLDLNYNITNTTYRKLRELRDLFIKYGVVPSDFQFIVSKEGEVYVIDLEYYRIFGSQNHPLFSLFFIYKTYRKFKNAESVIKKEFQKVLDNATHLE